MTYRMRAISVIIALASAACASAADVANAPEPRTTELGLSSVYNAPLRSFVVDGVVNALARRGTTLYVGGRFDYAGQRTGAWTGLMDSNGLRDSAYPEFGGGSVFAIEPDGLGGFFVGGSFTRVGTIESHGFAHILANGSVDTFFAPTFNGPVYALARQGLTLYVGGAFTAVSGMGRGRFAVFDTDTANLTSIGWEGANAPVRALALGGGGALYIGGDFTSLNGRTRRGLAAIDQGTGALKPWNPSPNGTNGRSVHALVSDGDVVYVGGEFTSIGGQTRTRLAAVDALTGLATAWHADLSPTGSSPGIAEYTSVIETIAVSSATVFVGGGYSNIGGVPRNNLAEIDKSTGAITNFNPSPDGKVNSLLVDGAVLRIGGDFRKLGGAQRMSIGAVSLTTGSPTDWNPRAGGAVLALAKGSQRTFAGGSFASVNGQMRYNLAAFDTVSRRLVDFRPNPTAPTNERTGPGGEVDALLVYNDTLYVGGDFTKIAGAPRTSAAAFATTTGTLLPWNPILTSNPRPSVVALAADNNGIAIGGAFTAVSAVPQRNLAKVDATSGARIAFDAALDGPVRALAVADGALYVAGLFHSAGGEQREGLASFDFANGTLSSFRPAASGILALAVSGQKLYVGGEFDNLASSIGGPDVARKRLAAFDRITGEITTWDPGIDVLRSASVHALTVDADRLYVGGRFLHVGASTRVNLASFDTTTGSLSPWAPRTSSDVKALLVSPDAIHVGGNFTSVRSGHLWLDQRGIAQYAGTP